MKKIFVFLFLISGFYGFSQEDAWVYFNAKSNAQTYYDDPLSMLSQRSLLRRTTQNIGLDFKDIPITMSFVNSIRKESGIVVLAKSKWMNAIHVRGTQAAINGLKTTFSFINKIEFADKSLNITAKVGIPLDSNKPNKTLKTDINYLYGNSANQVEMLNGHLLHQKNYTGSGKIIAVLDDGFQNVNTILPFQRLRDNNQILGGYNFVLRNPNFYTGGAHGTMVLSTMGGYKENLLVGTAPDASYYLFVTEDNNDENPVEESYWVEAAEKADSLGVDIITTSLGYFQFNKTNYGHTYSDMTGNSNFSSKGANIAFSKGIIVVASAGNEGANLEKHVGAPAEATDVLAVGAVNSVKIVSSFSSIGPSFDLRIKPDIMAQGVSSVVSDVSGNIVTASGTSFSCPIMAGMIACLWQAYPTKTNIQIKNMILQSADKFSNPNNSYGYGIPDFNSALNLGLSINAFSSESILIFPNPTTQFVTISLPVVYDKAVFEIYTVFGQKVKVENISNQTSKFSLDLLSKGVYIYKLSFGSFSKTGKIIKE